MKEHSAKVQWASGKLCNYSQIQSEVYSEGSRYPEHIFNVYVALPHCF